jgi:uncharacterized coiled-coil protein SlyX
VNVESEAPDERFVRLEVKLSYMEKLAAELNDVVVVQARRIELLEQKLLRLERHLRNASDGDDPAHEKPPHY